MKTSIVKNWTAELHEAADPNKIPILSSFFKTGPGEYGEGDTFIGLPVPLNRKIAAKYFEAPYPSIIEMLDSPIHEHRLSALIAMTLKYKKSKSAEEKEGIINMYIDNCHKCNNWDLVDLSAPYLLGEEILHGRHIENLNNLSSSPTLWHRRIAVVSTLASVRKNKLDVALDQCYKHISDSEPLMQKAVGWVLREVGKKDVDTLRNFLDSHISQISSTTLSYATERLHPTERQLYRLQRKHPDKRQSKG